ncbi:MAG: hypothetical protein WAM70_16525 [Pyrinomonadaceae bacterium]
MRIREEEVFRAEVRQLIAPPEKGRAGLWKFVNSPFALWFLSSVVLTFITAGVSWYLSNQSAERERSQKISKLTTEAKYRIEVFDKYVTSMTQALAVHAIPNDPKDTVSTEQMDLFYEHVEALDKEGVFKELSDRPLRSILWELQSIADANQRADFKAAFLGAQALQRLGKRDPDVPNPVKLYFVADMREIEKEVLVSFRRVPSPE